MLFNTVIQQQIQTNNRGPELNWDIYNRSSASSDIAPYLEQIMYGHEDKSLPVNRPNNIS